MSYHLGATGVDRFDRAYNEATPETKSTIDRMLGHLDDLGIDSAKSQLTVGPTLSFDADSEQFTGARAEDANRLLRRANYRKPFVVEEVS